MAQALAARGHAVTLACGQYAGAVTGLDGPFRRGRREGVVAGFRVVEWAIPCGNAMPGPAGRALPGLCRARYGAGARAGSRRARRGAPGAMGRWDLVIASSTPLSGGAAGAGGAAAARPALRLRDPRPLAGTAARDGHRLAAAVVGAWMGWRMPPAARAAAVVALSEGMAATALAHGAAPDGCGCCRMAATSTCSARRWRLGGRMVCRRTRCWRSMPGRMGRPTGWPVAAGGGLLQCRRGE